MLEQYIECEVCLGISSGYGYVSVIKAIEDGFIFCDVSHELVDKDNTIEYNPKIRMAINISHIETIEFLTN